jgi:biopolymer transport protein ExbD
MKPQPTPEAQSEPNVLPLIDVLLVLIVVYFTAVATQKVEEGKKQKALFAQVPPAVTQASTDASASIVLEIGPEGYRVNRTPVAEDALAAHLRRIYDGRPDKVLFVKGDPGVRYQQVVTAMDIARGSGVLVLGIPPKR